jgi:MFS transporter, putative metabolite:H+ symporter
VSAATAPTASDRIGLVPATGAPALIARFERIPFSRWHMRARIIVGSATFLDAFDALSMAYVLPVLIHLWALSPQQIGLLIGASYVGQVIGALVFSRSAETYGRIHSAVAAVAIMSVLSLGCAMAGNFSLLLACRFAQGIGVGGEMPVAATYIGELSRARGRGRYFLLYEIIFPVGLVAAGQIGTWLVPVLGWKIMFLIGGIPGLIVCVLLRRLPESPRWLISRGRLAEAEAVIEQAEASARRQHLLEAASAPPITTSSEPERSQWSELLSPVFRQRSLVIWSLWSCAFLITNSLNNWAPTLYHTVYGMGLRPALRAASFNNIAQVMVLLVCALLIDRIGRRNWTAWAFVAGGALLATLGIVGATQAPLVVLLTTLSYGIIGSANAVLYLYTPEIYPTRMRAIGVGLATLWLRAASAIGPMLVALILARGSVELVFLMFAGVSVLGALASSQMIETRGRSLEDIAAALDPTPDRGDARMR